ncbi:hypothetical protein GJ496_008667, partial [Pomphorhynchus laevis]
FSSDITSDTDNNRSKPTSLSVLESIEKMDKLFGPSEPVPRALPGIGRGSRILQNIKENIARKNARQINDSFNSNLEPVLKKSAFQLQKFGNADE